MSDDWETSCPESSDGLHCNCWYDGEACCCCGGAAVDQEDSDEQ